MASAASALQAARTGYAELDLPKPSRLAAPFAMIIFDLLGSAQAPVWVVCRGLALALSSNG